MNAADVVSTARVAPTNSTVIMATPASCRSLARFTGGS
jgi:hypothetical protein